MTWNVCVTQAGRQVELKLAEADLATEAIGYTQLHADLAGLRQDQTALEERQQQITTLRIQATELEQPLKDMRQALLAAQSNFVRNIEALDKSAKRLPKLERDLHTAPCTGTRTSTRSKSN